MAEEYQGLLADERLRVAEEAANRTRGRGGVFLAAKGAERMRQGTRSMLGIEEPVVAEAKAKAAKDAKLQSILSKYPNMKTRADYQKAINELYINGYTNFANDILNLMKELPEENKKPETYSSNDGTRYLTSGTFNGVNYTAGDLVPGETNKLTDKTFTGEELALNVLQNNPKFIAAVNSNNQTVINQMIKETIDTFGEQKTFTQNGVVYDLRTKQPLIEGSVPSIKTFEQGGVVYDLATMKPVLEGSEEDRPTFVQDGITYYLDTKEPVIVGSKPKRDSKLQDGVWRYVDNGGLVFSAVTKEKEPNQRAADILQEFNETNPGAFNTPEGKIQLANLLINAGVSNTQIFQTTLSRLDQDSVNAIQQENLIVKGVERLSENYVDSEVGKMDTILVPIEQQINEYMPHLRDVNGNFIYDRAGNALRNTSQGIPGWDTIKRYERYVGNSETVRQAKTFAEDAQLLINTVIKQRSGSAVSIQEAERLTKEYETGLSSSESFANWVSDVRKWVEVLRSEVVSGFAPEVQYRYFSQMGIYPTLHDPDEQLKALPIGAKWRDESGQLYTKTKKMD